MRFAGFAFVYGAPFLFRCFTCERHIIHFACFVVVGLSRQLANPRQLDRLYSITIEADKRPIHTWTLGWWRPIIQGVCIGGLIFLIQGSVGVCNLSWIQLIIGVEVFMCWGSNWIRINTTLTCSWALVDGNSL